ncbi:RAMP superfamily CRISPR-associated protein [Tabrizicola fusiformis]|uniref:RAMP superfamily CRISPR-associated protein n=1 Tax=Tabrizicola sp. SY72 TaxID=2741673 RepID=UPI00157302D5|nr:RAMP superfamily CRISPR-associated protein [Tabrizicola sp. SY72]NTT85946.1 hypothetical protein [Tabrizicola sp. SY72]
MTPQRWIIKGKLKVISPLSIRTGFDETDPPAPQKREAASVEPNAPPDALPEGQFAPVVGIEMDHEGRPYVPATALKGLLRARAAASLSVTEKEALFRLLGDQPEPGRDTNDTAASIGFGGHAEFRNSMLNHDPNNGYRPAIRGRTALHEGSLTAEDGQLRQDRIVAPGATFSVKVVFCRATEAEVALFLGLLALIDGNDASSALGSGTSQGDGRVEWLADDIWRFGQAEAKEWQFRGANKTWEDFATKAKVVPVKVTRLPDQRVTLLFTLAIEGHFLVGAAEVVKNAEGTSVLRKRPLRLHGRDDTTARLPGSGLDGALRAQAKRIYRTISQDFSRWGDDDTELPDSFASLFGSARAGSLLECEEFKCSPCTLVEQEFVAIDRLSGGGADERKFSMRAFESPRLEGRIHLVLGRRTETALTGKRSMNAECSVTPAAIGLLALTLKDLGCGDIPLGAATRKGYGGVRELVFGNGGWMDLLKHLGDEVLRLSETVTSLKPFRACLTGRQVIETAVGLLHEEARTWKAGRPIPEEAQA